MIVNEDGSVTVPLSRGYSTILDFEDYKLLEANNIKLHAIVGRGSPYAHFANGAKSNHYLHKYLMGVSSPTMVDHINHNTLDNRRANLRACTPSQNQMNREYNRGLSKYKGVTYFQNKWRAQVFFEGKGIFVGYFNYEYDAALAYNYKALELFGEFAYLNSAQD